MNKRTIFLVLVVTLALLGTCALSPANAGSRGNHVTGQVIQGGRYVMTSQVPQVISVANGGNYLLLSPNAVADTSGCCCKTYLPFCKKK